MGEFIYQKREKEEKGMIQRRSIAMCIILSLVTCGIYGIYWFVVLTDDANTLLPDNKGLNNTSGGVAFLLSLVTCGYMVFIGLISRVKRLTKQKQQEELCQVTQELFICY